MGQTWSTTTAQYLVDWARCPRCDEGMLEAGWCPVCGADLRGEVATELTAASEAAALAITHRQQLIDRLPTTRVTPRVTVPAATPAPTAVPSPVVTPSTFAPAARPESQISVQSVLAVAGAGLLAVAAIVFTFLNPDLTNFATRTTIIAIITAVFLGGALLLRRARLQFSAEAVGALGMVFVALDVWAFSQIAPASTNDWVFGAIGTLVSSVIMLGIGSFARIRTWTWLAFLGLAITPAFFGYADGSAWSALIGHLGVAAVALALHDVARRIAPRFATGIATSLAPERTLATTMQITASAVALVSAPFLPSITGLPAYIDISLVIATVAALSALGTRNQARTFFSVSYGALAVGAIALLPLALTAIDPFHLTLIPAAAGIAVVALAAIPAGASVRRGAMLHGAWITGALFAIPTVLGGITQGFDALERLGAALDPYAFDDGTTDATSLARYGLSIILGLAAISLTSAALSRFAGPPAPVTPRARPVSVEDLAVSEAFPRRQPIGINGWSLVIAAWVGVLALLNLIAWAALPLWAASAIGLTLALALAAGVVLVPRITGAPLRLRAPFVVGSHALVLCVAALSWVDTDLTVAIGVAVVGTIIAIARSVPAAVRPIHYGIAYAYALVILSTGLGLLHVEAMAALCLTTAAASVFALITTLARRFSAPTWYSVLIVTAVPFLINVGAVLFERSGWTALSTGVTFVFLLALVTTRREGLNLLVRTIAAALLVPSLAVVVVCLGAWLLLTSGSPVTLPIIAVIVACTLPSTTLIGSALVRHGISQRDADAAQLWIEISALVTAAIAVLLALVRIAAGFETTFLVLLILGIGATATALFTRRRYAWWTAAVSYTGALWCVWAIAGITVVEPYILPPALAAVIVGAALTARGRSATALYSVGLACAILPTLIILAVAGSGATPGIPWRTIGLTAGAILLLVVGVLLSRSTAGYRVKRLRSLQRTTSLIAIAASAAATVQAIRYGIGLDLLAPVDTVSGETLMLVALGLSAVSAILAAAAARLLLRGARDTAPDATTFAPSRWLFAAPLVLLAAGPIAAVNTTWFAVVALWILMAALLTLMLVTVQRARRRAVALPPVWFLFALAWCVGVASWSERFLRVEFFSLPLGLSLLAAGIIAMRAVAARTEDTALVRGGWISWPLGFTGSWPLLSPGILVTFSASVASTATDPQTWRAILVIALALVAILLGNLLKLASPFIIGIIVLPIENIVVFVVQIGQSIGAAPWWITLSTAGAVLLVLAVTSERRVAGESGGVASRLRDLK